MGLKRVLCFCVGLFLFFGFFIERVYCLEMVDMIDVSDDSSLQETPTPKPVVKIKSEIRMDGITSDMYSEEQAVIVDVAVNGNITVDSYNDCARWVWLVLQSAGFDAPYWSGAKYWSKFGSNDYMDASKIPVGAIAIGTGRNSAVDGDGYYYGHVGICVKNDNGEILIRDCIGPGSSNVITQSLSEWVSWQTDCYLGYDYHNPGFVGWIYYPDLERSGADFTYW